VRDRIQRGALAEVLVKPGQPPERRHHGDREAIEILGALPGALHPREVPLPAERVAALGILDHLPDALHRGETLAGPLDAGARQGPEAQGDESGNEDWHHDLHAGGSPASGPRSS